MTYYTSILPESALFLASFFYVDGEDTPPCLDDEPRFGDAVLKNVYPEVLKHKHQITLFFSAPCSLWTEKFAHTLLVFLKHQVYLYEPYAQYLDKHSSLTDFYKEMNPAFYD